jgi:hypothetical protein
MLKTICFALAACGAASAAAQTVARPDSAEQRPAVPSRPAYESAFKNYRPHVEPELVRWRDANDEMGRLKGHAGQVPGSAPASSAAPASNSGHAGHGGHK